MLKNPLRQMQIERIGDLEIGRVALHQARTQAGGLDRARLVGDVLGVLERAAQHHVTEHLRRLRLPQAVARHGLEDVAAFVRALERVGHRHREQAADLAMDPGAINIKGKTTEKLGFTGRGEGIAAQVVALLARAA